jgi:hypothetical protein
LGDQDTIEWIAMNGRSGGLAAVAATPPARNISSDIAMNY